jgi:hypothetical protein
VAEGRSIGTIFVELDLDPSRYQKGQQQLLKDATTVTTGIESNYKNLGIKSAASMDLMRAQIVNAYEGIKHSANATADDRVRAEQAMNAKLKTLNEQQFGTHKTLLENLKSHWLATTAAIGAAMITLNKAWGLINIAAEYEEQKGILDNLGQKYKTTANDIVASMEKASEGMISKSDLMQTALSGISRGLKPEQLIDLAGAANTLADAVGKDATEALQDLTSALETGKVKGLNAYLNGAIDLDNAFGKLAGKMTANEKAQAMYSLTMLHASEIQNQMTGKVSDHADQIARLNAQYANLKLLGGQALTSFLVYAYDGFLGVGLACAKTAFAIDNLIYKMVSLNGTISSAASEHWRKSVEQDAEEVGKFTDAIYGSTQAVKSNSSAQGDQTKKYKDQLEALKALLRARKDDDKAIKDNEKTAEAHAKFMEEVQNKAAAKEGQAFADAIKANEEYAKKVEEAAKKAAEDAQKTAKDRADAYRDMYKEIKGYAQESYDFELSRINEQAKAYKELGIDAKVITRWRESQEKKAWQDMALASNSFFDGIKVGYQRMSDNQYTWARSGLEVFQSFSTNASSSLSTGLFDVIKGNVSDLRQVWEGFCNSMLQTLTDIVAKMVVQWGIAQAAGIAATSFGWNVTGAAASTGAGAAIGSSVAGAGTGAAVGAGATGGSTAGFAVLNPNTGMAVGYTGGGGAAATTTTATTAAGAGGASLAALSIPAAIMLGIQQLGQGGRSYSDYRASIIYDANGNDISASFFSKDGGSVAGTKDLPQTESLLDTYLASSPATYSALLNVIATEMPKIITDARGLGDASWQIDSVLYNSLLESGGDANALLADIEKNRFAYASLYNPPAWDQETTLTNSMIGFEKGLDYVPYDNFPALLHEGERVLTKEETRQQDRAMTQRPGNTIHVHYHGTVIEERKAAKSIANLIYAETKKLEAYGH